MQLSKTDELFSIQSLLWSALGLDAAASSPAQLQAAAVPTCAAAARAICLQAVSCGSKQQLGIQRHDACKCITFMAAPPSSGRHLCQAGITGTAQQQCLVACHSNPLLAETCCAQAELHQLLSPEYIQRPLNPRNEAAALALLLTNAQSES